MVVLLVLFLIISFLTIDYFVQRAERRAAVVATPARTAKGRARRKGRKQALPGADPAALPGGVFVAPGHVWMKVEPSGSVVIGVDRLLLSFLGDVDCLYALPEGSVLREGGPLMMLRRGHRALKIRSPIAGAVASVNHPARRSPGRIATDPFGKGWIYRVSPAGLADSLKKTVVAEHAAHWMRRELVRLRDMLQAAAGDVAAGASLADGGLPAEELREAIGDREWEQLVDTFFADSARASSSGPNTAADREVSR